MNTCSNKSHCDLHTYLLTLRYENICTTLVSEGQNMENVTRLYWTTTLAIFS